jgi:hypothetical protein
VLVRLSADATDESAGGLACYRIETPAAVYYLEKDGAGLSSMLDKDGTDWIGFHPAPGSGAGGEYRGFPNAVHGQDGGFFHPKNAGTDASTTRVVCQRPERVTIEATSGNGTWQALWDFFPTHCTFTMTRMSAGFKYWVLYEGIPAGAYEDTDWWITSAVTEKKPLTEPHDGDIPGPEWIAFGDKKLKRSLFLLHHEDDAFPDRFYQMEKKMTVFGFGRQRMAKFLDTVPQRFSIGFLETDAHAEISAAMGRILEKTEKEKQQQGTVEKMKARSGK